MTVPFMVIDTDMSLSGMLSNSIFMSSTESIATPALEPLGARSRPGQKRSGGGDHAMRAGLSPVSSATTGHVVSQGRSRCRRLWLLIGVSSRHRSKR